MQLSSSCQSQAKCVIWASFRHFVPVGERERWRALIVKLLVSTPLILIEYLLVSESAVTRNLSTFGGTNDFFLIALNADLLPQAWINSLYSLTEWEVRRRT